MRMQGKGWGWRKGWDGDENGMGMEWGWNGMRWDVDMRMGRGCDGDGMGN